VSVQESSTHWRRRSLTKQKWYCSFFFNRGVDKTTYCIEFEILLWQLLLIIIDFTDHRAAIYNQTSQNSFLSASFLSESGFSSRGVAETWKQAHFLSEVHIKFFWRPHETKKKNTIGKITNLFCIYFFQIDRYIYECILTIFYKYVMFFISLPTKREKYYLQ
jgi:hypothetical protein